MNKDICNIYENYKTINLIEESILPDILKSAIVSALIFLSNSPNIEAGDRPTNQDISRVKSQPATELARKYPDAIKQITNKPTQESVPLSTSSQEEARRAQVALYLPMDVLVTILTGEAPEHKKVTKETPEEEKQRKERMEAWGREVKAKNLGPSYNKDFVIPGY